MTRRCRVRMDRPMPRRGRSRSGPCVLILGAQVSQLSGVMSVNVQPMLDAGHRAVLRARRSVARCIRLGFADDLADVSVLPVLTLFPQEPVAVGLYVIELARAAGNGGRT